MSNNNDNSNDSPNNSTPEGIVGQELASAVESKSSKAERLPESESDERDSEEETWTNQPRGVLDNASSSATGSDRFPDDDDGGTSEDDDGEYDDDDYEDGDEGEEEDYPEEDEGDDGDDVEGSVAGAPQGGDRPPRKHIQNARDVVCDELPDRVSRAATRLKPYLSGSIVFHFTNSGERFLFDWRAETPSTRQLERGIEITCEESKGQLESDNAINVDAIISISEANLMAVRAGSLNPQVGMLTEKIRVKGKIAPAVYVFNAVAPRGRA